MNQGTISRAGKVCILLSGLALALTGSASAAPVIDQEQPVIDAAAGFGIPVYSAQTLAQVVTPGLTGLLTEARFAGTCTGLLTVEVQAVSNGLPNGTVLGAETVAFSGSSSTFTGIVLSTPVPVTAGVPYALVLTSSGFCQITPGPLGNPYPGGDAFFDLPNEPGSWEPIGLDRADLPFQTLVDAVVLDRTPPVATCVVSSPHTSGKPLPKAAGFFQILGSDDVGIDSIVIRDSASSFVSMPFASGAIVKITQARGATPSDSRPGPADTVSHIKLTGEAVLRVTDTSGNITDVTCGVAPS